MTALTITDAEFELFRRYIETQCSIALADGKKYLLESRLTKLVVESGCDSFGSFYTQVIARNEPGLRDKIIDAMTTNETLWFRDSSPWQALTERILPELAARKAGGPRRLRIWSAACSTGQEPYTIAMIIDAFCRENPHLGLSPDRFEILATDISASALFIAKAGRYDRISMKRGFTDRWAPYKTRYFESKGPVSVVSDAIKRRITFQHFNLQDSLMAMGHFDLVFLRNVAIYFAEDFKRGLFGRIERALTPGGYFFLGSSETLSGYVDSMQTEFHERAIYYRTANGR
jgi:chemotaxis protein methyltransferase CheR